MLQKTLPNKEVNCTEPSPSVGVPWSNRDRPVGPIFPLLKVMKTAHYDILFIAVIET
jgi:hypothetical protein